MKNPLPDILLNFEVPTGNYVFERIGSGHINDTFLATESSDPEQKYILQRINANVFGDPAAVCDNSALVLDHIKKNAHNHPEFEYAEIEQHKRKGGISFYCDENNDHWRLTSFISDSKIYNTTQDAEIAYEAGNVIGKFQFLIHELSEKLKITIPEFHDFHRRNREFNTALQEGVRSRKDIASEEIQAAVNWASPMQDYYNELTRSGIRYRSIHNDTKLNNVLFNRRNKAVCMIDLDTVMPGFVHFDFGDAIRTLANTAAEDEEDISNIEFSKTNFEGFCKGYLNISRKFLSEEEIDLLAFSPLYMTYLIGLRFLTDYISGDIYFHTSKENHNLFRARCQFTYLKLLSGSSDFLEKTVHKYSVK